MGLPYYRWFPSDYSLDTGHLTLLQHGAYRHLIDSYMFRGKPLRGDLNAMCRVCNALSGEERQAVEFVLGEFFQQDGPLWRNKRCDRELEHLERLSAAGKLAARTHWERKQLLNDRSTIDERSLNDRYVTRTRTRTRTTTTKVNNEGERQTALAVLDRLNRLTGKRFKPVAVNLNLILARLHEGFTERDLRVVIALKVQQWRTDEKMMQYLTPKTLFNRTNFASYAGSVPPEFKEEIDELPRVS